MRFRTAKRLLDAKSACQELVSFCDGATEDTFIRDRVLKLAVHKLIEITGEALHQAELLEPDVAGQIPNLRLIVNTRNRITHGYESVNYRLLWNIVQTEVPELEQTLTRILDHAVIDEDA